MEFLACDQCTAHGATIPLNYAKHQIEQPSQQQNVMLGIGAIVAFIAIALTIVSTINNC